MTAALTPVTPSRAIGRPASVATIVSSPWLLLLIGGLLSLALSWSGIIEVWKTGNFADTDDAMRMVQVRAWLDGQGWFDLTAHRLDPPMGVVMHWSRVVDVPLAALIRGFGLFTTEGQAELLARLVFPLALQVAMIGATMFTGRVLVGPAATLPAMLLSVTSCMQFGQFVPGRIDHHAPQITLLMVMTGCAADAILRARPASAIWASIAIAVSLAISLENLPFVAVIVAALVLTWAASGQPHAAMLRAFGLVLPVATAAMFVATVAPWRYGVVTADALSLPHLFAALVGGGLVTLLAMRTGSFQTASRRSLAAVTAGLVSGGLVVAAFPAVLAGPYAALDPVVRSVWLARVTEALPLSAAVRLHPQAATLIVAPLLAGLGASVLAVRREWGRARYVWLFVTAMTLTGLAASFWEVRVVSSAEPLALLGGVWAYVTLAASGLKGQSARVSHLCGALALFLFTPIFWAMVPTPAESRSTIEATKGGEQCREAAGLAPLSKLSAGTVFAPIDSGSHLLVSTPLSVVAAPYHRNNHGNRTVIDGFSAEGAEAEHIVKGTGAGYVAICPGQVQAEALTDRNPHGLASKLLAGDDPDWLARLDLPGTPYLVFAVKP